MYLAVEDILAAHPHLRDHVEDIRRGWHAERLDLGGDDPMSIGGGL